MNSQTQEKFRTLFVVDPSHNVGVAARNNSDNIVFITTGDEDVECLEERISKVLLDFDPKRDAIIPIGKVASCLEVGIILGRMFRHSDIVFGIYQHGLYKFITVSGE
jgi:hypothetical protein